jgi:hypothetical protein
MEKMQLPEEFKEFISLLKNKFKKIWKYTERTV